MQTSKTFSSTPRRLQTPVHDQSSAPRSGIGQVVTTSSTIQPSAFSQTSQLPRRTMDDGPTSSEGALTDLSIVLSGDEDKNQEESATLGGDTNTVADEDFESDSDVDSTSPEEDQVIPIAILAAERRAHNQLFEPPQQHQVDRRYRGFLHTLCLETATEEANDYTLLGLQYGINIAKSLRLDEDLREEERCDMYAFALIIYLWQVVIIRLQHGSYPSDALEHSLSCSWSVYLLSSHVLVREHGCKVSISELTFAVQYWEERLKRQSGGTQWMKDWWAKDIRQMNQNVPFHHNDTALIYLKALKDMGKGGLTGKVMDEEAKGSRTQLRMMARNLSISMDEARREMAYMFYLTNTSLLEAIIDGQLVRKAHIESGLVYEALQKISGGDVQPGIYLNSLCDWEGLSPTPAQWRKVCDIMLKYVQYDSEHNGLAASVDQAVHPTSKWPAELSAKGLRRYMEWHLYTENGSSDIDKHHRRMVRYFISQLRGRIVGQTLHAPMSVPVVEIGFSNDPVKRLRQHRHHSSSNYLMNLAQAAFEYQYPGKFTLFQRIIYKCFKSIQTWMGEIVFTQLAQGYVDGGGGFSHEPAGRSNGSSFQILTEEEWDVLADEAYASGTFEQELLGDHKIEELAADSEEELETLRELHEAELRWIQAKRNLLKSNRKLYEAWTRFGS